MLPDADCSKTLYAVEESEKSKALLDDVQL